MKKKKRKTGPLLKPSDTTLLQPSNSTSFQRAYTQARVVSADKTSFFTPDNNIRLNGEVNRALLKGIGSKSRLMRAVSVFLGVWLLLPAVYFIILLNDLALNDASIGGMIGILFALLGAVLGVIIIYRNIIK